MNHFQLVTNLDSESNSSVQSKNCHCLVISAEQTPDAMRLAVGQGFPELCTLIFSSALLVKYCHWEPAPHCTYVRRPWFLLVKSDRAMCIWDALVNHMGRSTMVLPALTVATSSQAHKLGKMKSSRTTYFPTFIGIQILVGDGISEGLEYRTSWPFFSIYWSKYFRSVMLFGNHNKCRDRYYDYLHSLETETHRS